MASVPADVDTTAAVLDILRGAPYLGALAREVWDGCREVRPGRVLPSIGRWVCPVCQKEGTPQFGGSDIVTREDGLWLVIYAACPWTADRIMNMNAHRANGKRQRYWRPYHATLAPCGELYEFESVRLLGYGVPDPELDGRDVAPF